MRLNPGGHEPGGGERWREIVIGVSDSVVRTRLEIIFLPPGVGHDQRYRLRKSLSNPTATPKWQVRVSAHIEHEPGSGCRSNRIYLFIV